MINEVTLRPKPQNSNARVAFGISLAVAFIAFTVYFIVDRFKGIIGLFGLLALVTAILFYTKYLSVSFCYDVMNVPTGETLFVVRQITGKRETTLSRINIASITSVVREEREVTRAHKTPAGYLKFVYAPTLFPKVVYRITSVSRYEKAEIIIECNDEFSSYLESSAIKARENSIEE